MLQPSTLERSRQQAAAVAQHTFYPLRTRLGAASLPHVQPRFIVEQLSGVKMGWHSAHSRTAGLGSVSFVPSSSRDWRPVCVCVCTVQFHMQQLAAATSAWSGCLRPPCMALWQSLLSTRCRWGAARVLWRGHADLALWACVHVLCLFWGEGERDGSIRSAMCGLQDGMV